ncbi:hypothetical protein PInf_020433 [Phytophthora infestans]|nr:hypothetical protein PInf_020433 [Phytophthora infestans]
MATEMTTTETVTSEDVRALARDDVSGDVARSVAERGGYAQTTETSEETETFCRGYHYGNGHRDDHDGGNGNDGDTLAREDVSGDVARSVAERGGYAQTTETSEETETFCRGYHYGNVHRDDHDGGNGNDGDTLPRDDVSGDVTRSVAERGGYAVSSDCTSGAGTGSSKQTTETTEETETFCRGYHYGNGHRDDHDGGNGNDGDTLAREDVSGDVARSVAERGGYAWRGYGIEQADNRDVREDGDVLSRMTTTEETKTTETVTSEDVRALARDDLSGDVTRSVAERGGYDVSSDCTSDAGTGSSKQTTETTEETETFCRGYHYGNGHRDDHDGGNGNDGDTLAREDVSGDVARSVAERGGYAQTTETTEETETFCRGYHYGNGHRDDHDGGNGNDGDTLARDDVSGDVTRSVAERGGYDVSSDCTSGAGTGSSKQTTETTEETETFCRGYHYGNGHRDDHDGGNGNDGDTLAREDVSGDVARSVAERGGYAWRGYGIEQADNRDVREDGDVLSRMTTTEETKTTETVTSEDVRALPRDDVSGDVTRSVAERGGYDVSSDCTSGAGTGSSKQTTETTEETETFCRGYHYGNGHRDDHDGGNGNDGDTLAREDVSGDVARSVAERGGYAWRGYGIEQADNRDVREDGDVLSRMTTTEETKTTETVTSEDVRALARDDLSGDVTRSVAERGGYDVSSDCTSDAGTGSSKQTTETTGETETFCRGYHYGNGHRDDHDGGNGNDGDTLAREDVSGDVARSVAERGGYAQTTETTEETETFCRGYHYGNGHRDDHDGGNGNDGDTLARDDVSGDVTRSVAERGGYDVSSDCTSGAGTGSSKQTTETTEETETFCRGYHYGNGHRDDHDGGNGNDGDTLAREDVSGDVARSVAERGFVEGTTTEMSTEMTTTEETETTETVTSEDVRALARDDVSGDVTRSVAERGGYDVSSDCTSGAGTGSSKQTTETSEKTETFCRGYHYGNVHRDDHDGGNGNDGDSDERDVRALPRDDVRGDVTRSVAERGGYAVSSDCTSGAGTGSSKQTTETTEETETFCRGYHYGNGHRDDHDGGNENDGDTLAREDVSGDVARSVAERGGYAWRGYGIEQADNRDVREDGDVLSRMTTTEETKTTETVTSEDVRALARDDLSGDVTRSVAERGGYDVSSDCTSDAGTGSSKQTTETTEETETFCRGYHYGNGHRDDHDGGNGNDGDTLAREDVSGDVARSVAERGGYAQTTETTEETETFCRGYHYGNGHRDDHDGGNGNDGDTLARDDVSGDVTRSVAERGGYDVSSDCTSGAGTGSSKQTTETTEETETFCRGYHYGNGHRDDHDGGNGNDGDTLAREDVSGDVARSVAERGGYAWRGYGIEQADNRDVREDGDVLSRMTTTEETKTTETVTSEDVRALPRDDVSGDVTRSVAERGGYAGNTTEMATEMTTTEETETTETVTSEDVRALAREDVSGDVTRSVAERGFVEGTTTEMSTEMTTTEETETTETVTSEDVRALARDDVSGDVTRSVAERGGYDVSSDCTSGAGTGSSKQTTETSEKTETFCRGYHYGNVHRDDHDGGNGNDGDSDERDVRALARDDVRGDVTRSVAERGGYDVSSDCTSDAGTGSSKQTTETTGETETFCRGYHYGNGHRDDHDGGNGNDGDTLAREDVSGDVARSVAERGGYAQTTETTEETETFCRGYHYGNGHRDDHDGGNENDGDTLAREDVSGDVARSVAERGGYAWRGYGIEQADNRDVREDGDVLSRMTTTEETKTTETVTSEDVRALARDDLSGDVTRSVAERGGYDVSSDCTSDAGTGSSKQTTETTEETETFCRGYHYGNGHRDDHDGGNGNDGDTLAREDVSGDVARSVAERGGYAQTTETTEETETFCRGYHYGNGHRDDHDGGNGNDGDTLARDDVSGDVTRSVAERGGYDVSSDCTSGAGTGSSKQTTETTEETETFCRGYHYGNGHRDDHDGGNGNDGDTLTREDVSGDVARSVAERGGYAWRGYGIEQADNRDVREDGDVLSRMTTTEETKTTETVTSEDVRALARDDLSGDVTRSVAERGGYDVSSDCTSDAGTGSSKQTTETTEETETFCRGYHYGNGHRDDHDGGNGNDGDTLAREDVSGDVARSVAERGGYAQTTETTEETETFCRGYHYGNGHRDDHDGGNGNDGDTLARDDVSGDVTRNVAERGGYDVSSDCTSGAGTGSSKQTTKTTEETETFCRGYHYGNGHRDDHDGGNGNDGDTLAREDVSGDVARSVAERGGYAQTTETSEETETFCRGYHYGNGHRDDHDGGNGNDGDTLARDDVSGDVTRSVAERGGYDVSSDFTSDAGTGSSKQTTETTEETETFCRGYHYGNGHRDDHDGGNGNDGDTLAREDVSGDVTRSVAERGFVEGTTTEMSTEMTTTEETETTETVTSEDVRALARDDVSGDVTRSVAERGGYDVSSDCTSGAGTGSSKQTTETSEKTETFCRGYHYGNGHRDDHDGGNENDGDSDERGRESLGTRRLWLNAVLSRVPLRNGHRDDHDGGNGNDGDTLARDDVSGDVTRSVAERGGYDVSSDCTSGAGTGSSKQTTETSEETETFCRGYHYGNVHRDDHDGGNGNDGDSDERDVRALPRDDVSGDVTRIVAERGGYAVSFGCTSGAGTGSSKQTTETSEETETFCRGYHYGNGHRDDHDGGNENDGDTLARDDVSGDVTRSVAERGGYDVSSDCTSGAGTGSSKQTTETTEETETFCRGYHYGNGHRDDHDGGNGNDGDSDERGRESLGTRRREWRRDPQCG